jgi:hypothetical protein
MKSAGTETTVEGENAQTRAQRAHLSTYCPVFLYRVMQLLRYTDEPERNLTDNDIESYSVSHVRQALTERYDR